MKSWFGHAYRFVAEKIPFAITGAIATGINYGLYLFLVDRYLPYLPATVIAYSSSVLLNFFMQRYFVFELRRSLRSAFALSMLVSVGGLFLDAFIVWGLHRPSLFGEQQEWLIKGVATAVVFFYNFYFKRMVFEGVHPGIGLSEDLSGSGETIRTTDPGASTGPATDLGVSTGPATDLGVSTGPPSVDHKINKP